MLGAYLQYLREQAQISRSALAARCGLAEAELQAIETGEQPQISGSLLLEISQGLQLHQASQFANLVQRNGRMRKFRAYAIGLPKTGTNSIFGIFGNYTSIHDFRQRDAQQHLRAFRAGAITRAELAGFILERDRSACAEMDSANALWPYTGILAGIFPDAKFIGLIRDPFSWANSYINHFSAPGSHLESPDFLPPDVETAKNELRHHLPSHIESIIAYWAASVRAMLAELPPGRSLVVRTHEISNRIDDLAELVGMPPETLRRDQSHLNRAACHVNALERCDRDFLRQLFQNHCHTLVDEHFPGFSLDRFLEPLS